MNQKKTSTAAIPVRGAAKGSAPPKARSGPVAFGPAAAGGKARLNGDFVLGAVGCCLAAASAAFGIGMTVHGPVATLGSSKDFTVFAQLAPRHGAMSQKMPASDVTSRRISPRPAAESQDLDMTATASIPARTGASEPASEVAVIPSVTLEAVSSDAATVAIDGRTEVVRVGDTVPGAGTVLAILPGAKPILKTSRGLIVPAAE